MVERRRDATIRAPTRGWPRQKPERLIADKNYDSDPLRERLARRHIEWIVPHRRYRRRWVRRAHFSLLGNYRRLTVHWDRSLTLYNAFFHNAFFHIACFMILLRRVV